MVRLRSISSAERKEVDNLERAIIVCTASPLVQSTESYRSIRREYSRKLKKTSPDVILDLAVRLVDSSRFYLRFIAYELILNHREALKRVDAKVVKRLGRGLDSWGAVDTFACYISGPVWRGHQVPDKLIHSWALSRDRWWRRAALVSTVPLNNRSRGGSGDVSRTIAVCEMLIQDRDDMVVKAMSWALRELAKREPSSVSDFVAKHGRDLAPRVIREVNNKLRTGLKNPR